MFFRSVSASSLLSSSPLPPSATSFSLVLVDVFVAFVAVFATAAAWGDRIAAFVASSWVVQVHWGRCSRFGTDGSRYFPISRNFNVTLMEGPSCRDHSYRRHWTRPYHCTRPMIIISIIRVHCCFCRFFRHHSVGCGDRVDDVSAAAIHRNWNCPDYCFRQVKFLQWLVLVTLRWSRSHLCRLCRGGSCVGGSCTCFCPRRRPTCHVQVISATFMP